MSDVTVVCVWVGKAYGPEYVPRLREGLARHTPVPFDFICLTDRPNEVHGARAVDVSRFGLERWWPKMLVFNREVVGDGPILYIDIDNVIVGDLEPLADLSSGWFTPDFAMCRNFTQIRQERAGHAPSWPCRYSSTVMHRNPGWGHSVWEDFWSRPAFYMETCKRGGDQEAIERIVSPRVMLMQDVLPEGFFLHYKDVEDQRNPLARIVICGGRTGPADMPDWVREEWER